MSPDDLDVVMRDGLGLRYAFMGEEIFALAPSADYDEDKYRKQIAQVSELHFHTIGKKLIIFPFSMQAPWRPST